MVDQALKRHSENADYKGHRMRVKTKFLHSDNYDHFSDYELIEILLFYVIPRRDVKSLAKNIIKRFSHINGLLNCPKDHLLEIDGTNDNTYILIKIIHELFHRSLKEKIYNKNVIASWSSLIHYLKINIGFLQNEQFRILFLNTKNCLIADELMSEGTIDKTHVYPRHILKRALIHEAKAIIIVHNHPSGNCEPSDADIMLTEHIVEMCKTVDILVHDHVIVGSNNYYSFKSNGIL